jgi:hypothetical protein
MAWQRTAPRTALAGRNRIKCEECNAVIDGDHQLKRTVRWGFWDVDTQSYDRPAHEDHYCEDCWGEHFDREAAAYYEVSDPERFWAILEAANGRLVADLRPLFVGGRAWIRVVDGDLQALRSTATAREQGEERVIEFGVIEADVDAEWFFETFRSAADVSADMRPQIALLKPAAETPFADYEPVADDQTTFEEVTDGA